MRPPDDEFGASVESLAPDVTRLERVLEPELNDARKPLLRRDAAKGSRVEVGLPSTRCQFRAGDAPVERVEQIEGLEPQLQVLASRGGSIWREIARSTVQKLGPVSAFRIRLPNVPGAGCENAAGLKY